MNTLEKILNPKIEYLDNGELYAIMKNNNRAIYTKNIKNELLHDSFVVALYEKSRNKIIKIK